MYGIPQVYKKKPDTTDENDRCILTTTPIHFNVFGALFTQLYWTSNHAVRIINGLTKPCCSNPLKLSCTSCYASYCPGLWVFVVNKA